MNQSNPKFGYYAVGHQIFSNKIQALDAASRTGSFPTWHFNEHTFDSVDWTADPPFDLETAYRLRAEQLRSKFDHIVLFYSGGIDSHNILTTFIKNNIKLDAVVIYGTFDFDKNQDSKFNLELYNAAIPFARQHEHLFDLHLLDVSALFDKYYHEDWIYQSGVQLAPYEYVMGNLPKESYLDGWLQKGHTCLLRGLDKPRVIFHDQRYWISFLDSGIMQTTSDILDGTQNYHDHLEFFYWSPDAPWLIAKQAHVIKKYFKSHGPDLAKLLTHTEKFSYSTFQKYIVPLIYDTGTEPGQLPNYYSLGKTPSPVYHFKDEWFHAGKVELTSQSHWHRGINKIGRMIDPKFFNRGDIKNGLVGFWSKWYDLGD